MAELFSSFTIQKKKIETNLEFDWILNTQMVYSHENELDLAACC